MKDLLIEIKNNFQGNNSRVGEATNKSMIWNVRKKKNNQNQPLQKEERKKPKKRRQCRQTLGQLQAFQRSYHRGARRRRERARDWKSI